MQKYQQTFKPLKDIDPVGAVDKNISLGPFWMARSKQVFNIWFLKQKFHILTLSCESVSIFPLFSVVCPGPPRPLEIL